MYCVYLLILCTLTNYRPKNCIDFVISFLFSLKESKVKFLFRHVLVIIKKMDSALGIHKIEILSKDNYEIWKIYMEAWLTRDRSWKYVPGKCPKPDFIK